MEQVIKLRGSLLNVNYKPWKKDEESMCNLCSMCFKEEVYYFICICPILKIVRRNIFEKEELSLVQYKKYFRKKIKLKQMIRYVKEEIVYRNDQLNLML